MTTSENETAGLVGRFFHSVKDGHIETQGEVIGRPEPGLYLVTYFDWVTGEPSVCRLVTIDQMKTWLFYEDLDMMKHSYKHGIARAGGSYRS